MLITKDSNLYKDFEIAKNNSKMGKVIVEEWIEGSLLQFGAQVAIIVWKAKVIGEFSTVKLD